MKPERLKIVKKTIFWQEMNIVAIACFEEAQKHGWTFSHLADRADLSPGTVLKLHHRLTGYPQFMTIWKICQAVGFRLELASRSSKEARQVNASLKNLRKAFGRKPKKKKKKVS